MQNLEVMMSYISNMSRVRLHCFKIILFCIFLAGCNGNSSTDSSEIKTTRQEGVFIDSAVSGLAYKTPTFSGFTDSNGTYNYIEGELVTFSIGGITFPPVIAEKIVTPLTIANSLNFNNTTVINISRLLQTLDTDGDSSNGITLSDETHTAASELNDINFNSAEFDNAVINLVANSGAINTVLITAYDAIVHLQESISESNLIDTDGDGIVNSEDNDDDGDGTPDVNDVSPAGPSTLIENSLPTVNAGLDQTVNEQSSVILSGSASDTDGTIVTYLWAQTAGTSVSLSNADSAEASFTSPTLTTGETLSFSLTVTDNDAATQTDTIDIAIVNRAPVANADIESVNEDTLVNVNVLANDTDADGDALTITAATASNGAVTTKPDQTLDYVPNVNFNGSDTITYTISDGDTVSNGIVTMTVVPVNDAPTLGNITASIAENSVNGTGVATLSGSDVDGGGLTYSIQTNSADIFGINSNSGEINIADTALLNFETATQHEITIEALDSGGLYDTATATINITDVIENVTPTLDTSFGTSGTAGSNAFATENYDQPHDSVLDSSGRLVVVGQNGYSGSNTDVFITRFNTDGTLDRSFGAKGLVTLDIGAEESAIAVNIDSSGRIIIVGNQIIAGSTTRIFAARYTDTGLLDTTFNAGQGYHIYSEIPEAMASDAKLDGSGNIIIAASPVTVNGDFNLVKFSADGTTHDSSGTINFFGGSGTAQAVLIQSDGKAVLVGAISGGPQGIDFALARFDISSSPLLDTSYNDDGKAIFDFGYSMDDIAFDAYINASDDIVITGSTTTPGGSKPDLAAMKVDSDGNLIMAFGNNGLLTVDIDGDGDVGSNQSIGRHVIADASGNLYFAVETGLSNFDSVIYKTDTDGSPISAYGSAGQTTFSHSNQDNLAIKVLMDASNKALLLSTTTTNVEPDLVVARFTTDGILDSSYSSDGFNTFDPTFSSDTLNEMIELSVAPHAGKFIAVGTSGPGNGSKLIVTRYNIDGSTDESFGIDGYYLHTGEETTITGQDIVELSDGTLVAVGSYDDYGLIVKLRTDGKLETSFNSTGELKINGVSSELSLNAVAVDNDNNIVVAGTDDISNGDIYIARMNTAGFFDSSFASNGEFTLDLGLVESIEDIAIQADNAIVAVGSRGSHGLLLRVLANGNLDTAGFATNDGYLSLDLDPNSVSNTDSLKRVKLKANGTIVAAGDSTSGSIPSIVVTQISSNGVVDTDFDSDGIVTYNYGSGNAKAYGMTLDSNEQILLTGFNSNGTTDDIFIARITATGAKDLLFNSNGGILFDYGAAEAATAILALSDDTLMIAGAGMLNLFPTPFFFVQKLKLVQP
jgi:uncharacterized delta-60 repeat protein